MKLIAGNFFCLRVVDFPVSSSEAQSIRAPNNNRKVASSTPTLCILIVVLSNLRLCLIVVLCVLYMCQMLCLVWASNQKPCDYYSALYQTELRRRCAVVFLGKTLNACVSHLSGSNTFVDFRSISKPGTITYPG